MESPRKKKWFSIRYEVFSYPLFELPFSNYLIDCWLYARHCVLDGDYRDEEEKDHPCLSVSISLLICIDTNSWVEPLVSNPSMQCVV